MWSPSPGETQRFSCDGETRIEPNLLVFPLLNRRSIQFHNAALNVGARHLTLFGVYTKSLTKDGNLTPKPHTGDLKKTHCLITEIDKNEAMGMRFVFTHSHAFPKGTVMVENSVGSGPEGLVEFSDGVSLVAEWCRDGEDILLDIPSYWTAKGTMVDPHQWRLTQRPDGTWRSDRGA